jgi:hypothetical protein
MTDQWSDALAALTQRGEFGEDGLFERRQLVKKLVQMASLTRLPSFSTG